MKYYVAFDIGGTNCRIGLVSGAFKLLDEIEEPTQVGKVLNQSKKMFDKLRLSHKLGPYDIAAVGLSVASGIDKGGRAKHSPNLKLPAGMYVAREFGKALKRPAFALNDMKAAAVGELNFGLGKGKANFICITISTGIGAGIVADGKLYFGAHGLAGEVGAMRTPNMQGDFEFFGSGTGLEANYRFSTKKRKSAREIQRLAERGDHAAQHTFFENAKVIGYGLVSIINALDPELVIAHGSHILKGWPLLMPEIKKITDKYALSRVPIVKTKIGEKAPLLGAAKWASENV